MNFRTVLILIFILSVLTFPVFGAELTKIFGSVPRMGVNQVTIDNSANEKEAVIVFKEINWPIPFAVYLGSHQSGTLKVPTKSYQIYYTLGYNWNEADKRFMSQPEYFMINGIFNAGESGTIHEEKTQPQKTIIGTYIDEYNVTRYITAESDPAEWKWAESYIPLFPTADSEFSSVSINPAEFPLT
ncbi:MAG TPA: hypothetical protein PK024_08455 [Methanospirillum sp.]|uniref:hypothetical protein n=1 Tax=Methanospirillum sp. TaxID=45200 RepID=UPI002C0F09EA|nr:hypothetical protein [Methanospirillum sp.]HOJ96848.1 hypothetical protein [Methanospirillum sp.]HOL40447.1 hypothetical protein [Methanospirillum sp.]HPP77043.1 hypothetical protein [Methanospirillum sp.]